MKLVYTEIFDSAWKSFKDDLALTAGLTFVTMMGVMVASKIPFIGLLFTMVISAGYFRCLLQIRKKEVIGFQDFFWAFQNLNRFLHIVILNILVNFGLVAGFILLVIPGIWWMIASSMAFPIIILKDTDSIGAIRQSLDLVKGRWWNIFGFSFFSAILICAGFICFVIGALVTIPVVCLGIMIAVEQLMAGTAVQIVPTTSPISVVETTDTPQ